MNGITAQSQCPESEGPIRNKKYLLGYCKSRALAALPMKSPKRLRRSPFFGRSHFQHDLAHLFVGRHIGLRLAGLFEGEHPVDHRLQASFGQGREQVLFHPLGDFNPLLEGARAEGYPDEMQAFQREEVEVEFADLVRRAGRR